MPKLSPVKVALMYLSAPWCAPCKTFRPQFERMLHEPAYQENVTTFEINVDEHPRLAGDFGLQGIPAVAFLVNGQPWTAVQGTDIDKVREFLDRALRGDLKL